MDNDGAPDAHDRTTITTLENQAHYGRHVQLSQPPFQMSRSRQQTKGDNPFMHHQGRPQYTAGKQQKAAAANSCAAQVILVGGIATETAS